MVIEEFDGCEYGAGSRTSIYGEGQVLIADRVDLREGYYCNFINYVMPIEDRNVHF